MLATFRSVLMGALLTMSCALLASCSPARSQSPPPPAAVPAPAPGATPATVELTEPQLQAIRIEPVGTHAFSKETRGVGTLDFDEDLALVQARSTLLAAAATYELSDKVLARVTDLYGSDGGIPRKELEQAASDRQTAAAALKAARDAVRALGSTDAEIDRVIAARRIESSSSSTRWLVANVAESDVPFVHLGQEVTLTVSAYPDRTFTGKVAKVYAVVDPTTHRGRVRCAIADPANELRPGMLANFSIRVRDPVDATSVPANAVVREGDGSMTAWITADRRRFEQRAVETGLRQGDRVEILAGLRRGELVVSDGGIFLSNLLLAPPSDD